MWPIDQLYIELGSKPLWLAQEQLETILSDLAQSYDTDLIL